MNTLYVVEPQAFLRLENENVLVCKDKDELGRIPLRVLESIVTFGSLGVTPALMGACVERGIALSFHAMNGRFLAKVDGAPRGNVLLRRTQYRWADGPEGASLAQRFVVAKVHNQKVVLQRFRRDYRDKASSTVDMAIEKMSLLEEKITREPNTETLRGLEGKAADHYFAVFDEMILSKCDRMRFNGRSRRPPRDPVNALLSFFYSLLSHDVAAACSSVGLDPYVGFLHTDRPGRQSLALDVMEELRAYMVDRFVLSAVNRGQVGENDFEYGPDGAVAFRDEKRKAVIGLWQERKREEITHPFLKEKIPLGLLPYVQALLLARYMRGDLDDYPAFLWR
jgi:CRISPR-associated protein Cas1